MLMSLPNKFHAAILLAYKTKLTSILSANNLIDKLKNETCALKSNQSSLFFLMASQSTTSANFCKCSD